VIEVADSSLQHDRLTKKRIYARAGIAQFVLINLVDRVVEVFDTPSANRETYERDFVRRSGETVGFSSGDGRTIEVEVSRLLPVH
jgi:Uma2 family endonuclease